MTETQTRIVRHDQDGELTLRDLIHAFHAYRREALRSWWLYALAFVLIGGYLFYRATTVPPTYQAKFTFMVNEEEGGGLGGMSSVLGQLGLGRARTAGRYNLDKIIELAKSRKIIQQVLLSPVTDSAGVDYVGNKLIKEYQLEEKWKEGNPVMEGFRFTHDSIVGFDARERSALLALHSMLIGGEKKAGLVTSGYNDLSGILTLTCTTTNPDLSIEIAKEHYNELGDFYINQAIERQQKTYELVRAKVDSIAGELSRTDVNLAVYSDASTNLFSRVDQVRGQKYQRDIMKLSAMQAEAVKNMEYAEFMLKNARPVIQELDIPLAPLQPARPSRLKALLIGAAVAFVLVTLYVVFKKVFREAMA